MKRAYTKQDGMSLSGYAVTIALLGFCVAIALKLLPIYIEHYYVIHSLEALKTETGALPEEEIKSRLMKDFAINDIKNVGRKHIKIKHIKANTLDVSVEYDVQRQLVGNIDVIVHFSNSVELQQL